MDFLLNRIRSDISNFIEELNNEKTTNLYRYVLTFQSQLHANNNYKFLSNLEAWDHANKILDVGCGPGTFLSTIKTILNNKSYLGIDVNSHFIEYAQKEFANFENCSFITTDFFDYDKAKYDILVFWAVLQHLVDMPKSIDHMSKLLLNNGHVIIFDVGDNEVDIAYPEIPMLINYHKKVEEKVANEQRNQNCLQEVTSNCNQRGFKIVKSEECVIEVPAENHHSFLFFQIITTELVKRFYQLEIDQNAYLLELLDWIDSENAKVTMKGGSWLVLKLL